MYVGAGDRAAVLACFDETSATVFASLCRLSAGDPRRALDLLVDTYGYLDRAAMSGRGAMVDRQWMLAAAHSVYAAQASADADGAGRAASHGSGPVSALSPTERVITDMHLVDGQPLNEIAVLLGITEADAAAELASGSERLAPGAVGESAGEALRRCEVWFDDTMRSHAHAAIAKGATSAQAPAPAIAAWSVAQQFPLNLAGLPLLADAEQSGAAATSGPPPRSRLITIGAAIAVVVVLASLVVWLSPTARDQKASPPFASSVTSATTIAGIDSLPSDPVPTTTSPFARTPTSVDAGTGAVVTGPTGYIVDPIPPGFVGVGASHVRNFADQPRNWLEIWATSDAARTAGRWFAVEITASGLPQWARGRVGGTRHVIGGMKALQAFDADGVQKLAVGMPDNRSMEFASFGISADELLGLAATTTIDADDKPVYGAAVSTMLDDLELRLSRYSSTSQLDFQPSATFGGAAESDYASPDQGSYFSIVSEPQTAGDLFVGLLLSSAPTDPAAAFAPDRKITINGREMIVGEIHIGDDRPTHYIAWHEGSQLMSLVGAVGLDVLFQVAAATRLATPDEWYALVIAPIVGTSFENFPTFSEIGRAETADGERVTIRFSDYQGGTFDISSSPATDLPSSGLRPPLYTDTWIASPPASTGLLVTIASLESSIVAVTFLTEPLAKTMRVTIDGRPPVDIPIVAVGATGPYGVAYAFSELVPYGVQLLDANGGFVEQLDQ